MRVIKFILKSILLLIVIVTVGATIMPNKYTLTRDIIIDRPVNIVKEQTVDFRNFQVWSPWSELDSNMQVTFAGEPMQIGASYTWSGNKQAGTGMQEITAISENRVDIALHFKEPFKSEATTYFEFTEENGQTKVVWGMSGRMPWPLNLLNFMMKNSIGNDYNKGLNNLKLRCESMPNIQEVPLDTLPATTPVIE
jgi:hypothetical protein